MTGQSAEVSEFSQMLSEEFIIFEKKAKNRKDVIKARVPASHKQRNSAERVCEGCTGA